MVVERKVDIPKFFGFEKELNKEVKTFKKDFKRSNGSLKKTEFVTILKRLYDHVKAVELERESQGPGIERPPLKIKKTVRRGRSRSMGYITVEKLIPQDPIPSFEMQPSLAGRFRSLGQVLNPKQALARTLGESKFRQTGGGPTIATIMVEMGKKLGIGDKLKYFTVMNFGDGLAPMLTDPETGVGLRAHGVVAVVDKKNKPVILLDPEHDNIVKAFSEKNLKKLINNETEEFEEMDDTERARATIEYNKEKRYSRYHGKVLTDEAHIGYYLSYLRGYGYDKKENNTLLDKVAKMGLDHDRIHAMIADKLLDEGKIDEALERVDKAIKMNPKHLGYKTGKARMLLKKAEEFTTQGKWEDALRVVEEAVKTDPSHHEQVTLKKQIQDHIEAEKVAGEVKDAFGKKDYETAMQQIEKGLKLEPFKEDLDEIIDDELAETRERVYKKKVRKRVVSYRKKGKIQEQTDKEEEANKLMQEATQHLEHGRYEEALQKVERVKEINPLIIFPTGMYEKIVGLLARESKKIDQRREHVNKARELHEQGNFKQALRHAEKALALNPEWEDGKTVKAAVLSSLSLEDIREKRFEASLKKIKEIRQLRPDDEKWIEVE